MHYDQLSGGEAVGKKLHVGEVLGFNLELFNKIKPRETSIDQQMNPVELLTDDVIAFQFVFKNKISFLEKLRRWNYEYENLESVSE